jgi:hypothetical protein
MSELIELTAAELHMVSGGAGTAAAAAGSNSASAASGQNLGVAVVAIPGDGTVILRGEVAAGAGFVLAPASLGAAATGS